MHANNTTTASAVLATGKINAHIEIVGSTNPRLNAMTAEARASLLAILTPHFDTVSVTIVDTMKDLELLVLKRPDLVILGMKLVLLDASKSYDDSPKMWLSDYLNTHNIAFTGSDTDALFTEFHKSKAKQRVIDLGLRSAAYFLSELASPTYAHTLRYPLFVKPDNRGDSKGIDKYSLVHNDEELRNKIDSIHKDCSSDAVIEEYLPGKEFSVAVLRRLGTREFIALPIEIRPPVNENGESFLSETIKEADLEQVIVPDNAALYKSVSQLAVKSFKALGSRDYGRIDIRLDAHGNPHFIEANLMPGLSNHGYLVRCFTMNGTMTYETMVLSIVQLGLERVRESSDTLLRTISKPKVAPRSGELTLNI